MNRNLSMFRFPLLPVLTLLVSSTLILGQANAQTPASSDEQIPRKLLERILNYFNSDTQLIVGKIPAELPVDLPLPAQAEVVATILDNQENYLIIIDTPQSPKQVETFYRKQLEGSGWRALESYTENYDNYRGFVPSELNQNISLSLCKGNERPLLSVNVSPGDNAPTDVRLIVDSGYGSIVCNEEPQPAQPDSEPSYIEPPLPKLMPPTNSKVTSDGGGDYGDYSLSTATVETRLNIQALATHYEVQFKQAGWTRLEAQPDNSKAVSLWTMKDQQGNSWLGVLSFKPVEDMPNQYTAEVRVWRL